MDIEDLSARVLISINQSVSQGKIDPRVCDLAELTNISERHVYRLLRRLRNVGLIRRERRYRRCVYELTEVGQVEARQIREYFRLP
jgi:Mn-dependent DtxR family transcriptional regulator